MRLSPFPESGLLESLWDRASQAQQPPRHARVRLCCSSESHRKTGVPGAGCAGARARFPPPGSQEWRAAPERMLGPSCSAFPRVDPSLHILAETQKQSGLAKEASFPGGSWDRRWAGGWTPHAADLASGRTVLEHAAPPCTQDIAEDALPRACSSRLCPPATA